MKLTHFLALSLHCISLVLGVFVFIALFGMQARPTSAGTEFTGFFFKTFIINNQLATDQAKVRVTLSVFKLKIVQPCRCPLV